MVMSNFSDVAPGSYPEALHIPVDGPFDMDLACRVPAIVLNPDGAHPPLVLIQSYKGEIPGYQGLARCLGPDQPLLLLTPPGSAHPRNVDEWVDFFTPAVRNVLPDGPYYLGGWSFGGVLALSIGERLVEEGEDVRRVVMLDSRVPLKQPRRKRGFAHEIVHYVDEMLVLPRADRSAYLKLQVGRAGRRELAVLRSLVAALARRLGRKPEPVAIRPPMNPLRRAVRMSYLKYEPFHSSLPVSLFWCLESCERTGGFSLDWNSFLRGPFESRPVLGNHDSMFGPSHCEELARGVEASLERARTA
jgi:thioesterase domain-containing protein